MNHSEMLSDILKKRDALKSSIEELETREAGFSRGEGLSKPLSSGVSARVTAMRNEFRGYEERAEELGQIIIADEQSREMSRKFTPTASTSRGRDESVYRPDRDHSFFRDLYTARSGDWEAQSRLRKIT